MSFLNSVPRAPGVRSALAVACGLVLAAPFVALANLRGDSVRYEEMDRSLQTTLAAVARDRHAAFIGAQIAIDQRANFAVVFHHEDVRQFGHRESIVRHYARNTRENCF